MTNEEHSFEHQTENSQSQRIEANEEQKLESTGPCTEEVKEGIQTEQKEEVKTSEAPPKTIPELLQELQDKPPLEKLSGLGYQVLIEVGDNDYGKLRQVADPKAGLKWEGQQHYDFLADALTEYIQEKMKEQLDELWIPEDKDLEEDYHHLPRCNIFLNKNFQDSDRKKALILIQGTGNVRAGVWARSVCMNENLEKGSTLPFLEVAKKNDLDVLVMNPNYNRDPKTRTVVPYCHSMEAHATYVWEKYVKNSKHTDLYIVAHSAGGACLASIQKQFKDQFYDRVKQIALTDSWTIDKGSLNKDQAKFMKQNCVHYVASSEPVGEPLKGRGQVCPEVSAGHPKHEYTTGYAFRKIIEQFGFAQ